MLDPRSAAELVEWAGIALPRPARKSRAAALVVAAFDDFPGQSSSDALLGEAPADVIRGAAVLAAAAGGASPHVLATADRCVDLEAARDVAPSVGILAAPSLHALTSPRLLATWLSRQSRFDGADPGDFAIATAEEAAMAGAAERGRHRLERWVTVAGAVRRAGTFLVPHGTTVATLVRLAGGRVSEGDMPYLAARGSLRPAAPSAGITSADGTVAVLPGSGVLVRNRALPLDVALGRIDSVCSRCQLCDEACPVAAPDRRGRPALPGALLDAIRYAAGGAGGTPPLGAAACIACGICETVCPTGLPVARVAAAVAERLATRGASLGTARPSRLIGCDTMGKRLGLGRDPAPPRDARNDVRRVRMSLGTGDVFGCGGDRVWRGQVIARHAATGGRVLAPISGTLSRSATAVTIRRPRETVA